MLSNIVSVPESGPPVWILAGPLLRENIDPPGPGPERASPGKAILLGVRLLAGASTIWFARCGPVPDRARAV